MASSKKDTLAVKPELDMTPGSQIIYANDVVATIVGLAVNEVDGIAAMVNPSGSLLGKKSNVTKGVKVEIGTEEASIDLYVIVEYGTPIQKAAKDAQENVRKAVESMTGLHVVRVDVHVQGVSFEKENKSLEAGKETAYLTEGKAGGEDAKAAKKAKARKETAKSEPAPEVKPEAKPEAAAEEPAEPAKDEAPAPEAEAKE